MFLHADSEDSDQTGRMPRLIWESSLGAQPHCWFCHVAAHCLVVFVVFYCKYDICTSVDH